MSFAGFLFRAKNTGVTEWFYWSHAPCCTAMLYALIAVPARAMFSPSNPFALRAWGLFHLFFSRDKELERRVEEWGGGLWSVVQCSTLTDDALYCILSENLSE